MTAYEMRISDWSSDVCSSDLRVDLGLGLLLRRRDAHVGDGAAGGVVRAGERPVHHAVVVGRADGLDHHVVAVVGAEQVVDGGLERPRQVGQLVDGQAPVPGLDPADRRRSDVRARGQLVERPAPGLAQAPQATADEVFHAAGRFLLHQQDAMRKRAALLTSPPWQPHLTSSSPTGTSWWSGGATPASAQRSTWAGRAARSWSRAAARPATAPSTTCTA